MHWRLLLLRHSGIYTALASDIKILKWEPYPCHVVTVDVRQ